MPPPPAGAVPITDAFPPLPPPREARSLTTRPATPRDLAAGQVYYQFYCAFCHGIAGDGQGPVGLSFVPFPADLRTQKVRGMSDGEILRAMLTGAGHEPVLEHTVLPQHRWPLVHYVRGLSAGPVHRP
jgi:mono/diheme cytochrome c family protein